MKIAELHAYPTSFPLPTDLVKHPVIEGPAYV
jgi:hypothetical protein